MRLHSLVALSLVSACSFRTPRGIAVRVSAKVHADVQVQGRASVDTTVVPLQGAPVTEFFGIPLADARDVLFLLDVSGSMADLATGQLALIPPPPAPSAQPAAAPPTTDAPPSDPSVPPPPPVAAPPAPPPAPIGPRTPSKLEVAQAELIETLAKLPDGTRLNIIIFSNDIDGYAPSSVVLDATTRQDMIEFVREMQPQSATALQPAMRTAFLLNAPRVVLLSDGLGNIGGNRDDILRDVHEAMRGGLRIDAVGIGPDQDTRLLAALTEETGGLYQRF